ncbi:glutamine amidotransferase-related protein [Dyadobacter sp. CY312]|uniref:glutamine amidotransferase-related protein n=1 Tax=Dyadobacter sp. CY312 TaxID=2907303 RepID=UPI001F1A6002|nr:amidotransferase [Dyadobacter sp. CY312]MCE7043495.1 amidotransferase [Dyadobacter sp. CY312]
MKVGLLECDHVREELQHIAGDYRNMFPALFLQVAPDWEFEFYDVCQGQFPEYVNECDVYICTGSKSSVYDDESWIHELKEFIRQIHSSGKVFIGVCFGHQSLGEALGGKVQKSSVGWCVGVHSFDLIKQEEWMSPQISPFNLLMMCQDQVLHLPPESVLLAQTADCPNAMFRVGNNMLGIQAHPEFPKDYDKALMEIRVDRIGAEKVAAGVASLKIQTDQLLVAEWIRKFVLNAMK